MTVLGRILTTISCLLLGGSMVYAAPVLESGGYEEHFESGSVGAWSSYPPSQDTAYDPTIWVKPVSGSNRALFREITPNYEDDCSFGVRRIVNLWVTRESALSFRACLKSNRPAGGIQVRLGYADGASVEKILPLNETSVWKDFTLNMAECGAGERPRELRAVAFMAVCPKADPENLLRFGLDDVKITGLRESLWQFSSPQVHKLDEWSDFIAAEHYRVGGSITISGRPPFTPRAIAVRVNRALTGDRAVIFPLKKSGSGMWSVNIPLTAKSGIGPGLWRATILTSTKEGESLSTSMVFLVKSGNAPQVNPRLLMGPGDAPKILAKTSSGRLKTVWDGLVKSAVSTREKNRVENFNYNLDAYDDIHWLPTYGGYVTAIWQPSGYIRSNAVVYGLSGDAEAGDAACRALLKMAQWPSYVHPHILNQGQYTYWPVGQMVGDMAVGYDLVRDRMKPEERSIVARALYSKGVTEIFKEYVRDNRVSSFTSNWIGDVTGGGILCSLAIMNDIPERELEPYLTGMILKMDRLIDNAFDRDGHYGEGYSYLNHALECINQAAPALERTFGIEFPDVLGKSARFMLYQADTETKRFHDFGDTSNRLGGLSNFAWILAKYKDPHLKWLYDRSPGNGDVDLFLADESIASRGPEDLPKTVLFRDTGTTVFRSGFGKDDFLFVFRCGPFYNHQHFDQGGFVLSDRGEVFLSEAGRTDYYFDPWYQKLFIQAGGHNCILLDDKADSQRSGDFLKDVPAWKNHASTTDFLTFGDGAFVSGKLDPLYKGRIEKLRRSALYLAPRTVVLIDEASGPHDVGTLDLRFHAPFRDDLAVNGNTATVTRPGGKLFLRTLAPAKLRADIVKRPPSMEEFGSGNALTMKARGFLRLSADIGTGPLILVHALSTDSAVLDGLGEKSGEGCTLFSHNGTKYAVNTTGGGQARYDDIITDALVSTAGPYGFMAARMTVFTRDGEMLARSDKPVSLSLTVGKDTMLNWSAAEGAEITLHMAAKPAKVLLNGRKFDHWTFSPKNGLRLTLEPGEGVLDIKTDSR